MRILIIGAPRTGTSSLIRSLGKVTKYSKLSEPFNYTLWGMKYTYPIVYDDNIIVKMTSAQVPIEYNNGDWKFFKEFIIAEIEKFDFVILLNRKNLKEHWESYLNLVYRHNTNKNCHDSWSDLPSDVDSIFGESYKTIFKFQRDIIHEISSLVNIDISWYEDLYGIDRTISLELIKSWNLNIDNIALNELLHPKFKYKKSKSLI
jgi:hypothetical protein